MKKINTQIRYSLNDILSFEDSQFNSFIKRETILGRIPHTEPATKLSKTLRKITTAGLDYEVKRIMDEIFVLIQDRISIEEFNAIKQKSFTFPMSFDFYSLLCYN